MHVAGVTEPDDIIVTQVLLELKDHVERHGFMLSENSGLPGPDPVHIKPCIPCVIQHETEHNIPELEAHVAETEDLLNDEQHVVVKIVMESVEQGPGKMIAVDTSGATGKTFTSSHILAHGKVAFTTAASGIAVTILLKGTTFHSRTNCPLILADESTCNVGKDDSTVVLIRMTRHGGG